MWKDNANEEAAFGEKRRLPHARRGVFVTARAVRGYLQQRNAAVSRKLEWSDSA